VTRDTGAALQFHKFDQEEGAHGYLRENVKNINEIARKQRPA
jgi:hypothetical protein